MQPTGRDTQLALWMDKCAPEVPAAPTGQAWLDQYDLRLLVKEGRDTYHHGPGGNGACVGCERLEGERYATVHVISPHAGGQIRGYFLVAGRLHLMLPSYPPEWPEVDAAVCDALGAEVVPYAAAGTGGMAVEAA